MKKISALAEKIPWPLALRAEKRVKTEHPDLTYEREEVAVREACLRFTKFCLVGKHII